jgi:3-oxoacyl-[acyl-carrier protein] reductase
MKSLAIITGASRGIGLATAKHFMASGWCVFNIARTPCLVKGVVNHACDLSESNQLQTTLKSLDLTMYEKISIIHNAAILCHDDYVTLTENDFLHVLKLNVVVPQIINRHLIPCLPKGSSIICIGSTLSEKGAPNLLSYVTSKHAMAGLMKAMAQDLAERFIHTCLVCPGFTDTQMLRESVGCEDTNLERVKGMVLLKRLLEPEEIASLIFFCSNNPAINGSVIHANLGQV